MGCPTAPRSRHQQAATQQEWFGLGSSNLQIAAGFQFRHSQFLRPSLVLSQVVHGPTDIHRCRHACRNPGNTKSRSLDPCVARQSGLHRYSVNRRGDDTDLGLSPRVLRPHAESEAVECLRPQSRVHSPSAFGLLLLRPFPGQDLVKPSLKFVFHILPASAVVIERSSATPGSRQATDVRLDRQNQIIDQAGNMHLEVPLCSVSPGQMKVS